MEAMADSDGGGKRELLEPRLGAEGSREKLVCIISKSTRDFFVFFLGERPFDWKTYHHSNGPIASSGFCKKFNICSLSTQANR